MLEYDNSAFYYFSFTFLALFIIPAAYYTVKDTLSALNPQKAPEVRARTSLESEKAKQLAAEQSGLKKITSWIFLGRLLFLIVATLGAYYLLQLIQADHQIAEFNPYTILGLEQGADDRTVKKAYRTLSLKYHPDQNPGNQTALEIFLKVAKAYEALTDPIAKQNWQEYGNPDGKQAMEVSIGLPTFLLDKDNQSYILVIYLLTMVIIIPVIVGVWYANSKQYGEKNVMYKTYSHFYQLLTENHRLKHMPEVLASAQEYFEINAPKLSEKEELIKLIQKLKAKQMHKPKHENPILLKGNCLLHAHVLRMRDQIPPNFVADLDKMLRLAPELLDALIEMSWQRQWFQTTLSAIRFSQCLVQALWQTEGGMQSVSLLQIPHFTENEVKHVVSGKVNKNSCKTLGQYLRIPDDQKKGLADFTEQQRQDVLAVLALLPVVDVNVETFVEEEADEKDGVRGDLIVEKDIVTIRVTLTRTNVPEGQKAPPVHAPFFPRAMKEGWWVILTDKEERIHAVEKLTSQERVVRANLKFMAPPTAGSYSFEVHVLPDCYMGLDELIPVTINVASASELPEYKPHPEDLELDNEPTLFEQVMAGNADESDSDEEGENNAAEQQKDAGQAESKTTDAQDSDNEENAGKTD